MLVTEGTGIDRVVAGVVIEVTDVDSGGTSALAVALAVGDCCTYPPSLIALRYARLLSRAKAGKVGWIIRFRRGCLYDEGTSPSVHRFNH